MTINNVFHSRRGFLHAPARTAHASATATLQLPAAGEWSVLMRYEAAAHFSSGFRLQIIQRKRVVFDRLYGMRGDLKLWAFVGGRVAGPGGGQVMYGRTPCSDGGTLAAECVWE